MLLTFLQEAMGVAVAVSAVVGVVYCLTHLWYCWLNPQPKSNPSPTPRSQ